MAENKSAKAAPAKVGTPASKITPSSTGSKAVPAKNVPTTKGVPAKNMPAPRLVERKTADKKSDPKDLKKDAAKKDTLKKEGVKRGADKKSVSMNSVPSRNLPLPRFLLEPERIGHMIHDRPGWIDEIGAIALIVAGAVSLLSLFNTTPAVTLASAWSQTTRTLVGQGGAFVLSIMIMVVGVLIVLPRIGVRVSLRWQRVVCIEVAFAAFLALLHLLAHDPEPRALARAGLGGGYIGWALSELLAGLFGSNLAIFIYGVLFVGGLALAIGIRRVHIRESIIWLHARITALIVRLTTPPPPRPPRPVPTIPQATAVATTTPQSQYTYTPPAAAAAASRARRVDAPMARPLSGVASGSSFGTSPTESITPPNAPMVSASPQPLAPPPVSVQLAPALASDAPPAIARSSSARESIVPRPPKSIVPRPDGVAADPPRHTRHFTVEGFLEVRMPLKRSDDLPPMSLLNEVELNRPTEQEINTNVRIIENTLLEFDIDVEIVDVKIGPTVTQYAVQPFREVTNEQGEVVMQRVRVNKIASLSSDLALALSAKHLRIQPYVPGHTYMGIEVPNRSPSVVALRPVMESEIFSRAFTKKDPDMPNATVDVPLVVPLGRDVSGASFVADLATMPHLLIAGTTGSGKSVCITALTLSLVMNNTPDRLKLVMLDPKMVELTRFNGLPHLLGPVETDMERIVGVLRWATREMDRRYKLLEVEAARNIESYNRALGRRRKAEHLPYIVFLVDEIGDLMLSRPEEVERTLTRLAQMARAVGMHLVVATQRPSVDIITGLIKANFPARLSFAVASGIDSRVILDTVGAETLMGRGDMLYLASDAAGPQRLQGCYISDEELERIVAYWKQWQIDQVASGNAEATTVAPWERGMTRRESLVETDPLLEEAIDLVITEREASASQIQRHLGIDFPRAAHILDMLQQLGVTGATRDDGRTREVLIKPGTDRYKKLITKRKG